MAINKNSLEITYILNESSKGNYDLGSIGESLSGFNKLFVEFFKVANFDDDVSVQVKSVRSGSIVFDIIFSNNAPFIFTTVKDLYDFLQVVDVGLYKEATLFFSQINNAHLTINDYFEKFPFDSQIVSGLIAGFVVKMFFWGGKQKKQIVTRDENGENIPLKFAAKLQTLIKIGKFRKALTPLTEDNVDLIQIGSFKYTTRVEEQTLESYLPDDAQILPDLENGKRINLTGEILALQSTKGELIKFRANEIEKEHYLLTAHPLDGKRTEDFLQYYKKKVKIRAEVYRKTLYKKPEIIIHEIDDLQKNLF